jgi:GDPmannose 4,6-dehydratase
VHGNLSDSHSITKIIVDVQPDEIYNLAAQSHVRISFDIPEYSSNINGLGTLRILEAVKNNGLSKKTKIYQASTSELFGNISDTYLKETTPFSPRSPYAVAKLYAYWIMQNYKEGYDMFTCNGILFNHESPRRGEDFVTRKISLAVARIKRGAQQCLYLGNLDSKRDWGYSKEYVEVMWRMLQQDKPEDFVIGTGESHSARDFLEEAFKSVGIEIESNGKQGVEEEYIRKDTGEVVVKINPKFYRPTEVHVLLADASKAKKHLGWEPKVKFKELVDIMVIEDLKKIDGEINGTQRKFLGR